MDFAQFDSRAAAETARDLQMKHPVTGELMFDDGKPCIVTVIGTESREAQAAIRAVNKAKAKGDKTDDQTIEDLHKTLAAACKPLIKAFKNIGRGDKPAVVPDDVDWFLNLQLINGQDGEQSFVEQVSAFATKRANFLGNDSKA